MKYMVFGDTGGHLLPLMNALKQIGLDVPSSKLPEDVTIIHVGDLIHKGPNSDLIIEKVDKIKKANPGRWVQLMGNHESQYFAGAPWFWNEQLLNFESRDTLLKWKQSDELKIAYLIPAGTKIVNTSFPIAERNKPFILTHAGVTKTFWKKHGSTDPETFVKYLNNASIAKVSRPGEMLGYSNETAPGPFWASVHNELYASWYGSDESPFIQIHGHTSTYSFSWKKWWPVSEQYLEASKIESTARAVFTAVADTLHIAIDPGFSKTADLKIQPYLQLVSP